MTDLGDVDAIRAEIDRVDRQLLDLISERARLAQAIAEVKRREAGGAVRFYRPEREAAVLERIRDQNSGPLQDEDVMRLFREIMSACLGLEQPLSVAYLGPEGTFTQAAAVKHFGHWVVTKPLPTVAEVFREVAASGTQYGVVPIENSTEGIVTHTLDMFMDSPCKIVGEVLLRIHHFFLTRGDEVEAITRIYSHTQSFAQCRNWLDEHFPRIERVAVSSNGEAARLASEQPGTAAIAGEMAAELYGLCCAHANIEDRPENTTRFLVIGSHDVPSSGNDKSSLMVTGGDRPGALYHLLAPLAENGVNMTRIESRPSPCMHWEYVFFLDVEGHIEDTQVAKALRALEHEASWVKVLGAYPRAIL